MLLGSDVTYSLKALPSLFHTAAALLSKRPTSVFILGYVSRSCTFSSLVDSCHRQCAYCAGRCMHALT